MPVQDGLIVDFDRRRRDSLDGWIIPTRWRMLFPHALDGHGQVWWWLPSDQLWYGLLMPYEAARLSPNQVAYPALSDWWAFQRASERALKVLGRLMRPGTEGERQAAAAAIQRVALSHQHDGEDPDIVAEVEADTARLEIEKQMATGWMLDVIYGHGRHHFPDRPPFDPDGKEAADGTRDIVPKF